MRLHRVVLRAAQRHEWHSHARGGNEYGKTMNATGGRWNGDYGWELTVFRKIRSAADGVTIFEGKLNWDRYLADHSPRFEFHLVILNYTVIEFNIFYLHHRDESM